MPNADEPQESLQGLRILLVEDDPLIRLDLEASLSELGAMVTAASDLPAALKAMAVAPLDFAVLDFELGIETSEPVAKVATDRNLAFLYLSGYGEHDERFARWPGAVVLVKPISAITIARHVRAALRGHRQAAEPPSTVPKT
jgi:DNA-binding response OmpR family regulator